MRRLAALALLLALSGASTARAEERYAPLLRDLDRAGLLEQLIARTVATQWAAAGALVPAARRTALVDPLREVASKTLTRRETRALLGDLLDLHEKDLIRPQLDSLLIVLEAGRGAAVNAEALAALAGVAAEVGVERIARLAADVTSAVEPAPLSAFAAEAAALPQETWNALDGIALQTLEAGAMERTSKFFRIGPAPGRGLEPLRAALPGALCALRADSLKTLSGGSDYLFRFIDSHPEPQVLLSLVQWAIARLDDSQAQRFLSASLAYRRLPQLAAAHRTALQKGVLREVLLDYADFLAGTDRRVRVDPELWKQMQKGALTPETPSALSGIDLVKLGALTLFTVHRLDDIPSSPRADGGAQTLADELLDYTDYQMEVQGKRSTFSPLFDAVREFLASRPDREVLLATTRRFAAYVMVDDPAPLLAASEVLLGCDPEMSFARAVAHLFDESASNGDLRVLTPALSPSARAPSGPLTPLLGAVSRTRGAALSLTPALRAALVREQEERVFSTAAVALGRGKAPLLVRFDPLLRASAAWAPVWRVSLGEASEDRIARGLAFMRAAAARDGQGRSDLSQVLGALAAWEEIQNPLSDRSALADAGVVAAEALRAGLLETILDAALVLRREDPEGVRKILEAVRAVMAPPVAPAKQVGMP